MSVVVYKNLACDRCGVPFYSYTVKDVSADRLRKHAKDHGWVRRKGKKGHTDLCSVCVLELEKGEK